MNISDWPLGNIMQLPDNVFGRRFIISCQVNMLGTSSGQDISELAFPEICVIWELILSCSVSSFGVFELQMALGDQLPTVAAPIGNMEPLFYGLGLTGAEPRVINLKGEQTLHFCRLKILVRTSGRRLAVACNNLGTGQGVATVAVVVSGVPREIPDCLISV